MRDNKNDFNTDRYQANNLYDRRDDKTMAGIPYAIYVTPRRFHRNIHEYTPR